MENTAAESYKVTLPSLTYMSLALHCHILIQIFPVKLLDTSHYIQFVSSRKECSNVLLLFFFPFFYAIISDAVIMLKQAVSTF